MVPKLSCFLFKRSLLTSSQLSPNKKNNILDRNLKFYLFRYPSQFCMNIFSTLKLLFLNFMTYPNPKRKRNSSVPIYMQTTQVKLAVYRARVIYNIIQHKLCCPVRRERAMRVPLAYDRQLLFWVLG